LIVRTQLPPHRSTATLADELVHQVEQLVRLEKELAIQEVKELGVRNGIAAGLFGLAGVLVMTAVFSGVMLLVYAIWPHWWTALITIAVYVVLAAVAALIGKMRLLIGAPPKTMRSLQETKEWALTQLKSNGR
jgi:uncharacterized membrane protein YqjE